jgi:hypothetical protein
MKAYGGVDTSIHIFLTSALVRGEWLASRPCRFTPEEKPLVDIEEEAGSPPDPVWTTWRRENS